MKGLIRAIRAKLSKRRRKKGAIPVKKLHIGQQADRLLEKRTKKAKDMFKWGGISALSLLGLQTFEVTRLSLFNNAVAVLISASIGNLKNRRTIREATEEVGFALVKAYAFASTAKDEKAEAKRDFTNKKPIIEKLLKKHFIIVTKDMYFVPTDVPRIFGIGKVRISSKAIHAEIESMAEHLGRGGTIKDYRRKFNYTSWAY